MGRITCDYLRPAAKEPQYEIYILMKKFLAFSVADLLQIRYSVIQLGRVILNLPL
jgi:hypothetical protein